jgi:hypothetical protein
MTMAGSRQQEMMWYDDGHSMFLELNRTEVLITTVMCSGAADSPCRQNKRIGCLVQHFLGRFGLEVNVGVCPAAEQIPIAWAVVGDPMDVDLCQVWVVPTGDDVFAAWAATMRST